TARRIQCSPCSDAAKHREDPYRPTRAASGVPPRPPSPADAPARHSVARGHARRTTLGSRDTFGLTTRFQPSVCLRCHWSPTTGASTSLRPEYAIRNFYVKPHHAPFVSRYAWHRQRHGCPKTSMVNPRPVKPSENLTGARVR